MAVSLTGEPDRVALRDVVASGLQSRAAALDVRPSRWRTSLPLFDVDAVLADGREVHLVCKELSLTNIEPNATMAKHPDLFESNREIGVYQQLLSSCAMGTPALVGVLPRLGTSGPWLIVERVSGSRLQEHDVEAWLESAAWFGRMHQEFAWVAEDDIGNGLGLIRQDRCYWQRWAHGAREVAEINLNADAGSPPRTYEEVCSLLGALPSVWSILENQPATLLHGDAFASNILVDRHDDLSEIHVVDWEMASLGCALFDIASLTAGWHSEEAARIATAYREGAIAAGANAFNLQAFDRVLDACRVVLAVQWLGWHPVWTPPLEQQHDWLTSGTEALSRLKL